MTRRDLLVATGRLAATLTVGGGLPVRTWASLAPTAGWSAAEESLLERIGDTILPATPESPGAAAVGIGRFITRMTDACFPPEAGVITRRGLREIAATARRRFARDFGELPPHAREEVLNDYERQSSRPNGGPSGAWRHLKELTLLGYFTSEAGATQALRYDPVPGGYRGSIKLAPEDPSWAP